MAFIATCQIVVKDLEIVPPAWVQRIDSEITELNIMIDFTWSNVKFKTHPLMKLIDQDGKPLWGAASAKRIADG
jgi:hypothetical protein